MVLSDEYRDAACEASQCKKVWRICIIGARTRDRATDTRAALGPVQRTSFNLIAVDGGVGRARTRRGWPRNGARGIALLVVAGYRVADRTGAQIGGIALRPRHAACILADGAIRKAGRRRAGGTTEASAAASRTTYAGALRTTPLDLAGMSGLVEARAGLWPRSGAPERPWHERPRMRLKTDVGRVRLRGRERHRSRAKHRCRPT